MRVRTDIPYGNACRIAVQERDGATEIAFASDPHGGPERLWFCLRIERELRDADRLVRLIFLHPETTLGGSGDLLAIRPVLRSGRADWERLGPGDVATLLDGRKTVAWTFPPPAQWAEIAYCYPYGPDDVDALVGETGGYWHADEIGVSQGARPIVRLANDYGAPDGKKPGIYLLARQHSGETPGSWVLDGFLRRLAERPEERLVVWAAPLANIDGVVQGDYGKDNFPYDLNRAWGNPPMRHETLLLRHDAGRWAKRCRPALAIDFHAPGGTENRGAYAFIPKRDAAPASCDASFAYAAEIGRAIGADLVDEPFGRHAGYASRWETPGTAEFFATHWAIPALTIETPYAAIREKILAREDYRAIGARVADCIAELAARPAS